jgi:hypothetical protein
MSTISEQKQSSAPAYWRLLIVNSKITEAKNLDFSKFEQPDPDLFCTARLDNNHETEYTTQAVANSESPFWVFSFIIVGRRI